MNKAETSHEGKPAMELLYRLNDGFMDNLCNFKALFSGKKC